MASHFAPQDMPKSGRTRRTAPSRSPYGAAGYSRADAAVYAQARRSGGRSGGHPGAPRKRHVGRTIGIVVGIVFALLLVSAGTVGFVLFRSAMTVKDDATVLMAQASSLKEGLKNGDSEALTDSVNTIVERAASINAEVHAPAWDLAAALPVVGQDVKSVQALGAVATDLASNALVPVSRSISGMKLSELLQDGAVDVDLVSALAESVGEASPVLKRSADAIASLPEATIPQLAEILGKVQGPVREAGTLIDQIQPILDVLPQMLGADGTRTYLIIAQNNAELRSTGGLPGSWGTITVSDGVISMGGEFETILHRSGLNVSATDEEVNYVCATIGTDPAQVNFTPDFARVGQLSREYWEQMGYGTVDGVIAIDPVFLQRLLALTGGLEASDGEVVDGSTAAEVLLSGTYWKYGNDGEAQDAYFSSVASLAFEQVMNNLGEAGMEDLWKVVDQSGRDGRLLVWMANEDEESVMRTLGLSGEVSQDPTKPVLGVYINDDTISKISWYTSAQIQIGEGVKNADGTTTYDVTTTITNTISPEDAARAPEYISGGNAGKRDVSDMLDYVYVYAPAGGSISDFAVSEGGLVDGASPIDCTVYGLQVVNSHIHARSGESVTLTYKVTTSAEATEPLALRTTPLAQESLM